MHFSEMKTPQFGKTDRIEVIYVPILNNNDGAPDRVIEFKVEKNGPAWHGREVFRLFKDLGEMSPAEEREAWNRAYAFWKESIHLSKSEPPPPEEEAR